MIFTDVDQQSSAPQVLRVQQRAGNESGGFRARLDPPVLILPQLRRIRAKVFVIVSLSSVVPERVAGPFVGGGLAAVANGWFSQFS